MCVGGERAGLFEECPENIVAVGVEQQKQQEGHADVLGYDQNLFRSLPAGDDLVEGGT